MDFEIIHYDEVVSTNSSLLGRDTASPCISTLHPPFTVQRTPVIVAEYQSGGRGCGTNVWESERSKNLLFSVLIHPVAVPAADQFILSMANALALRDALDD